MQRKAFASLVIDGRICGPRQECEVVIDPVENGGISIRPDRTLVFPSDRGGMGWVKFFDHSGNYLSATCVGHITRGHHVRLDQLGK